ncbi:unnamed protein product [Urochloa decumbens]|uniref:Peptidase C1A papain C-terminal domain-containing protein n=1 Tax=Urochloa decumbens TaxID=240449 RepID=A0ABC8ZSN8_9POAL
MVLKTYKFARSRYTWRNRHVDSDSTLPKVMGTSKNQDDYGKGSCAYVGTCCSLEAHVRIKTKQSRELSPRDLEKKVAALTKASERMRSKGRMTRCFYVLCNEGVAFQDSEETCKVESYRAYYLERRGHAAAAINEYLRYGPMIGVFEVRGRDLDRYGLSTGFDAIHFVNYGHRNGVQHQTHAVTIPGFGLQEICPFWEFQNTHGREWRGSARGYGQLYAPHLIELYGYKLAA